MSETSKTAEQVRRAGGFVLECSAETAFPLFSPEGERNWVPGWAPRAVFPETIEFRGDTVFRHGEGSDEAVWTIVHVDRSNHRAEYVRVAPASHAAHIIVKVDPVAAERCEVSVSYILTAFGDHPAVLLEEFSEDAFRVRMKNWQAWIGAHLQSCVVS